ncbi:MAG: pyridoxal phosphate-dependent aminotransferase [Anaerolineae bacterium]|nr:pyridoxal phosphate-dependent aminotransferase [Anaerolineae bacterium]
MTTGAFADRVAQLVPEGALHMLVRAQTLQAQGRDIVEFQIGQPDIPTFSNVAEAGIQAIRDGRTRYSPPLGIPELRQAIAEDAGRRRGIEISPSEVVVMPGGKPTLFFPTLALVQPGDEVIFPDPGFPTYRAMVQVAGGTPVPVPLREDQDFAYDLDAFDAAINNRTRMIVLNSPSNPTGGVLSDEVLAHITAAAQRHDAWILSDEIYSRLVFDGLAAPSIVGQPGMRDRTIICDGFSKTYAMTGWRLGYGIMPEPLADKLGLLLTHSVTCSATFTQYAGVEALNGPQEQVEAVVADYQRRRNAMVGALNAIQGVSCRLPQGAMYAFPNVKSFGKTSDWLATYLLEEAGVALLPGTSFGQGGEGYLRLCFASSMADIEKGTVRIAAALGELK